MSYSKLNYIGAAPVEISICFILTGYISNSNHNCYSSHTSHTSNNKKYSKNMNYGVVESKTPIRNKNVYNNKKKWMLTQPYSTV